MSELFNKVKKESINMRKNKDSLAPKSVFLVSTINSYAKDNNIVDISDEDVIKCVRSLLKKLNDIDKCAGTEYNVEEKTYLTGYLPKETSDEEINSALEAFFDQEGNEKNMKSMGKAMGYLKSKFGNNLNPSTASTLIKNFIGN